MHRLIVFFALIAPFVSVGGAGPVRAEVWEYASDGTILAINGVAPVISTRAETATPTSGTEPDALPNDRAAYHALAETVALQHSGADGVRAAGLDAVSFMQVFCALIDQESRFDPRAVSPKGAQGLGQLMPETAALLDVHDPFDPEANLQGAARYFTDQLETFQDVRLALAAYNAGPHRIVEHGGMPPFGETRHYVAEIEAAVGLDQDADAAVPVTASRISSPTIQAKRTVSVWEF